MESQRINLYEALLSSWLRLSAGVRNERLVHSMTFNEIFVCNLLHNKAVEQQESITATDLCDWTGIYKSQINKVLVTLEEEGILVRERSKEDKRKVILALTEYGRKEYLAEHERVLRILEALTEKLGLEKTRLLDELLSETTDAMKEISQELI